MKKKGTSYEIKIDGESYRYESIDQVCEAIRNECWEGYRVYENNPGTPAQRFDNNYIFPLAPKSDDITEQIHMMLKSDKRKRCGFLSRLVQCLFGCKN